MRMTPGLKNKYSLWTRDCWTCTICTRSPWLLNKYMIPDCWPSIYTGAPESLELLNTVEQVIDPGLLNKHMNPRLLNMDLCNKHKNPRLLNMDLCPGLLNKFINSTLEHVNSRLLCWTSTWTRDFWTSACPPVCDPEHAALESTYFSCIYLKLILTFRNSGFLFSLSYAFFYRSLGKLI